MDRRTGRRPGRARASPRTPARPYCTGWAARELRRPRQEDRARHGRAMKEAGVDFAIWATRDCTGDPARRAGNEFLFTHARRSERGDVERLQGPGRHQADRDDLPALLQTRAERISRFRRQVRGRPPHRLFARARGRGKLKPHRKCARASRTTTPLSSVATTASTIPRARSCGASRAWSWSRSSTGPRTRGLCCGAGGAQMFMEEQNKDRVNSKHAQLIDTGPRPSRARCRSA